MNGSLKRFVRDAFVGFTFWTLALSPVMLFVVGLSFSQFISWLGLQAVLGPPLGGLSAWVFRQVNGEKK